VKGELNRVLRGWVNYFTYGTRLMAYRAVDNYVYERVRHFLRRRHKVRTRGTERFSAEVVFGELGVVRLRRFHLGSPCACPGVKPVREPDAGKPHVRFDEEGQETE
jgi:RNA-directed DNA polymerase